MAQKLTVEQVEKRVENCGYTWVGPKIELVSIRNSKLTVKCNKCDRISKNSLKHSNTWSCKCNFDFDFKNRLNKLGWSYISGEYINGESKLTCKCNKCSFSYTKISKFFILGCLNCQRQKSTKYNQETIHKYINEQHKLIKYENFRVYLECKECNNNWDASVYDYVSNNRGCKRCAGIELTDIISLYNNINSSGYKVLDNLDQVGCETMFRVACSSGHVYLTNSHRWKTGNRCPKCVRTSNKSNMEREFSSYFQDQNIEGNFRIDNKFEIDIYFPDHKLGIEMNGIWYHSSIFKNKNYHLDKYMFFKRHNIVLIQIFENEWEENKEYYVNLVKSIIKNGLIQTSDNEIVQDNRFPIYNIDNYEETKIIEPEMLLIRKHIIYNAGYTVYKIKTL